METAKQKAIREAYEALGVNFYENNDCINICNGNSHESLELPKGSYDEIDDWSIRPKSLQGIETNNGWINIESEADLPKEGHYWVIGKNGEMYDSPKYGDSFVDDTDYWMKNFTHYQPIVKPKPPIY